MNTNGFDPDTPPKPGMIVMARFVYGDTQHVQNTAGHNPKIKVLTPENADPNGKHKIKIRPCLVLASSTRGVMLVSLSSQEGAALETVAIPQDDACKKAGFDPAVRSYIKTKAINYMAWPSDHILPIENEHGEHRWARAEIGQDTLKKAQMSLAMNRRNKQFCVVEHPACDPDSPRRKRTFKLDSTQERRDRGVHNVLAARQTSACCQRINTQRQQDLQH